MNPDIFRFRLGGFECFAVSDGTFNYGSPVYPAPSNMLFANAPKEHVERAFMEYRLKIEERTTWAPHYICLLVNTGEHLVLIDTGASGQGPNTGKLIHNLRSAGISIEFIDRIIITHAHSDHIGGCTENNGALVFPRAKYVISKDEWEFWRTGKAESALPPLGRDEYLRYAAKNLPPLRRQLELVEGEVEIYPGIRVIPAPGHTPGHIAVTLSSQDHTMLVAGDAWLHQIHFGNPIWYTIFDLNPETTIATRRQLLERAVSTNALVMGYHLPFPGIGKIVPRGMGYIWQPLLAFLQSPGEAK